MVHKDQPRSNGIDSEAGIPVVPTKEGRQRGRLLRVDPNHSHSSSTFTVPRKTELHLPGSSSALAPLPALLPAPPRPTSSRDRYIKGRMARPSTERGGGAARRVLVGTAGRGHPGWHSLLRTPLSPRASFARRAPTLRSPDAADRQTRGGEPICPWLFPGLGRGVPAGIWARAGDAQRRNEEPRRGWVLSQN